jgi:colanic acid biosynthesis protein WcaH
VSIDLIVRDADGRVLLGLRNNRPARDWWFVPGGIVRPAASRIISSAGH